MQKDDFVCSDHINPISFALNTKLYATFLIYVSISWIYVPCQDEYLEIKSHYWTNLVTREETFLLHKCTK